MVAWVPDRSGRFGRRPHFSREELDRECEAIVGSFLRSRYGEARYPISTDDLTVLVERHTSSLDLYADLSAHGEDVEGMTEFFADELPAVAVSERLSSERRRENRLRTTLAHELGHALFHRALWAERFSRGGLFERAGPDAKAICKRDTILEAREVDWMEWQAGYASGAIVPPWPAWWRSSASPAACTPPCMSTRRSGRRWSVGWSRPSGFPRTRRGSACSSSIS